MLPRPQTGPGPRQAGWGGQSSPGAPVLTLGGLRAAAPAADPAGPRWTRGGSRPLCWSCRAPPAAVTVAAPLSLPFPHRGALKRPSRGTWAEARVLLPHLAPAAREQPTLTLAEPAGPRRKGAAAVWPSGGATDLGTGCSSYACIRLEQGRKSAVPSPLPWGQLCLLSTQSDLMLHSLHYALLNLVAVLIYQ